jgi:hypothetical protein
MEHLCAHERAAVQLRCARAELDLCVIQILIEAPGKAPFRLTRLGGAPHGQPALALRQVQVRLCCFHPTHARLDGCHFAPVRRGDHVQWQMQ